MKRIHPCRTVGARERARNATGSYNITNALTGSYFLVSNVFNNVLSLDRRQSIIQTDMHVMLTNLINKKAQYPARYSITCVQLATFKFFIWKKFSGFIVVFFSLLLLNRCNWYLCGLWKNAFFFSLNFIIHQIVGIHVGRASLLYLGTVCRVQAYQYSPVSQRSFSYRLAARTTCIRS